MRKTMMIQFEAGEGCYYDGGVNFLSGENDEYEVYAECAIPEDASDDYGYLTMKRAILTVAKDLGINTRTWKWQYDGQESNLAEDASAECDVHVEIDDEDEAVVTEVKA